MLFKIKCLVDFWYCKHFVLVNIKRHLNLTFSNETQTLYSCQDDFFIHGYLL